MGNVKEMALDPGEEEVNNQEDIRPTGEEEARGNQTHGQEAKEVIQPKKQIQTIYTHRNFRNYNEINI